MGRAMSAEATSVVEGLRAARARLATPGVLRVLRAALGASGTDPMAVARFNDAPTTTLADVLALFDRAIAAVEAQS